MKTRNIREVKVGDIVQDEVGNRYKVIELHKNTFACLDCDDELRPRWVYWMAFDEANEADWFIENKEVTKVFDGVDDSEEVEFTKEELALIENMLTASWLETELEISNYKNKSTKTKQYKAICKHYDSLDSIMVKLNKMLKEKE